MCEAEEGTQTQTHKHQGIAYEPLLDGCDGFQTLGLEQKPFLQHLKAI